MPCAMFRDVLEPRIRVRSRARYTIPLSILAHVLLCAAIIAVPLTAADVLPTPQAMSAFAIPAASPPPPPPPPPPPRARAPEPARTPQPASSPDAAPLTAPDEIRPEAPSRERAALLPGVPGGVEAGVPDGQIGGIAIDMPSAPPPATPPQPLHVGGRIKAPQKVRHVSPVYPPIALSARVQGSVIIDATIGPDGRVTDARVRRGVPLLDQAALDAVRQWEFTPTLLNGVAVPVIMTVTVTFTLR